MSFLYFLSLFLELFLFLGVVFLISGLTFMLFLDGIKQILVWINCTPMAVLVHVYYT